MTDKENTSAVANGFAALGLAPELLAAVADLGFTQPTTVQQQAIAMARAAHPEDDGLLIQYVRKERGPRIYASFRRVDGV